MVYHEDPRQIIPKESGLMRLQDARSQRAFADLPRWRGAGRRIGNCSDSFIVHRLHYVIVD